MELILRVREKRERAPSIQPYTITFEKLTKEHYVPDEQDLKESPEAIEEDYLATTGESFWVTTDEADFLGLEVGDVRKMVLFSDEDLDKLEVL